MNKHFNSRVWALRVTALFCGFMILTVVGGGLAMYSFWHLCKVTHVWHLSGEILHLSKDQIYKIIYHLIFTFAGIILAFLGLVNYEYLMKVTAKSRRDRRNKNSEALR